jgi:hypothetical protein
VYSKRSQAIIAAQQIDPNYNGAKADIEFAVNKTGASNFEKLYNNVTSFEKTSLSDDILKVVTNDIWKVVTT